MKEVFVLFFFLPKDRSSLGSQVGNTGDNVLKAYYLVKDKSNVA